MSAQRKRRIVSELMDDPHVEGHRISVLTIRDRVEGRGLDPQTVADRHDLDLAAVYEALAHTTTTPRRCSATGRIARQLRGVPRGRRPARGRRP